MKTQFVHCKNCTWEGKYEELIRNYLNMLTCPKCGDDNVYPGKRKKTSIKNEISKRS